MAKPFTRKGLHRLECPCCPCYGYFTVAMLENAGGLPVCFAGCDEPMVPVELELMELLEVSHPVIDEWERMTAHKQASQVRLLGRAEVAVRRLNGTLNDMGDAALEDLRQVLADASRDRRLAGLGIRETRIGRDVVRVKVARETEEIPF